MPTPSSTIHDRVATLAQEAGFSKAGIAPIPQVEDEDYPELDHFEPWIERGSAGEMEYLKRRDAANRLLRSSLRIAVPWARSVIVCAANYNADAPKSIDPASAETGWIARYAWTGYSEAQPSDYHDVLLARLKGLEQRLQPALGPFAARCYVDTGPLVERIYAKYAGIGWIGKNTCIIDQDLGSWLFLGVILTDLELPSANPVRVAEDRCGSCTQCIDACPTGALVAPYQMDASLCIAYLTIEKRGPIAGAPGVWLRHLPGCLPVESPGADQRGCGTGGSLRISEPRARLARRTGRGSLSQPVPAISCATGQAERLHAQRSHRHGEQRPRGLPAQTKGLGGQPRHSAGRSGAMGSRTYQETPTLKIRRSLLHSRR